VHKQRERKEPKTKKYFVNNNSVKMQIKWPKSSKRRQPLDISLS
jgi:hypothetical protein